MKILCEMKIVDFFWLSTGYIAIVGLLDPNVEFFIGQCKADLYIENKKIKTLSIIGEDRFSRVDEKKRQGRRSVLTVTDISKSYRTPNDAKLIIYED